MRAAAVQLQSTTDTEQNLASAERLVRSAVAGGAELVVLPERLDIRGAADDYLSRAEPLDGRPITWARELARDLGIDLVAGSVAERREGHERVSNTSVHVGPDGEIRAVYRKIHMFDIEVEDTVYRESEHSEPAAEIVLSETAGGAGLGLTVCYDLRFPELYRARAIEDQVFVIAPGQGRLPGPERDSYGNSMIVDPWGEVLARAPMEGEHVIAADLDLARQDDIREKLPSLAHRVDAAYRWPKTPHRKPSLRCGEEITA
jgi:predicted amidohydrolase